MKKALILISLIISFMIFSTCNTSNNESKANLSNPAKYIGEIEAYAGYRAKIYRIDTQASTFLIVFSNNGGVGIAGSR